MNEAENASISMNAIQPEVTPRKSRWMIYGANGYTGRLIAQLAREKSEKPILAGRNKLEIEALAAQLGFESRVFAIEGITPKNLDAYLDDVALVVVAAGPFIFTSKTWVDSCLRTGTHYMDITGEIPVFESIFARNSDAVEANVALIPGCGFDVVPTDCLAKMLHNELPTATHLAVALWSYGGAISQGTTKSALRLISSSRQHYSRCRKDGKIVEEEIGARVADVLFSTDHKSVVSAPLPDVSSAYYSTGIMNISGYLEVPPSRVAWIKSGVFRRILDAVSFGPIRWMTDKAIEYFVSGPSDEMRKVAKQEIFVRVYDYVQNRALVGRMTTPEGYITTAYSVLAAVRRVLSPEFRKVGALTPSMAFGEDFIKHIFDGASSTYQVEIQDFELERSNTMPL